MTQDFIPELTETATRLSRLQQMGRALTETLTLGASQLEVAGLPPSEDLIVDLTNYRNETLGLARLLGVEASPSAIPTLAVLERVNLTRSRESRIDRVLESVIRLEHQEDPQFAPLKTARLQAIQLRREVEADPAAQHPELALLLQGHHPLQALARFAEETDQLGDDDWNTLNDRISATWGRSLAVAVSRGKIRRNAGPLSMLLESMKTPALEPVKSPVSDLTRSTPTPARHEPSIPVVKPVTEANPASSSTVLPARPVRDVPEWLMNAAPSSLSSASTRIVTSLPPLQGGRPSSIQEERPTEILTHSPTQITPTSQINRDLRSGRGLHERESDSVLFDEEAPARPRESDIFKSEQFKAELAQAYLQSGTGPAPLAVDVTPHVMAPESRSAELFQRPSAKGQVSTPATPSGVPVPPKPVEASRGNGDPRIQSRIRILAQHAVHASGTERLEMLADLVLELVRAEQPGLAYHLARGLETRSSLPKPTLPSWLVRALALSQHVNYPRGEVAQMIETDLRNFHPELLSSGNEEWSKTLGLLVRAAALPPALLAPSATTASIFKSFHITAGTSQFYNYCSRVSSFGENLRGQAMDILQRELNRGDWQNEMASLQDSAVRFQEQHVRETFAYRRASPLFLHAHWTLSAGTAMQNPDAARQWNRWQETLGTIDRLLTPVIQNIETDRALVRQEVARLSNLLNAETSDSRIQTESPLTREQHRQALRGAIDLANGWLRLWTQAPSAIKAMVSQEAEDLKLEISRRTAPVLAELEAFGKGQPALGIATGVLACRRALTHLQSLFDNQTEIGLREEDPRHILHAELLKIPMLRMNSQWEPEVDPAVLENELLVYLSNESIDWLTAFEMQCDQGDHVATARLLDLNVWGSGDEIAELRSVRASHLQRCHELFDRELDETLHAVQEAIQEGTLTSHDRTTFETWIQRLKAEATGSADFALCNLQLGQVRLELQRRLQRQTERKVGSSVRLKRSSPQLTPQLPTPPNPNDPHASNGPGGEDDLSSWVLDLTDKPR